MLNGVIVALPSSTYSNISTRVTTE